MILRIGDEVIYCCRPAKVVGITEVAPGQVYGTPVTEMPWLLVPGHTVVDLDNGHWAYGDQVQAAND